MCVTREPTSSEGLSQHLSSEGGLGAAAGAVVMALLGQVFPQHVPPPAV